MKKFNWLAVFKIIGVSITILGVVFSFITGSMYGNTKSIFGVLTLPLFGLIVAFVGFILFFIFWRIETNKLLKQEKEEKAKQKELEKETKQKKKAKKLYTLIKKKDANINKMFKFGGEQEENLQKDDEKSKKND